MYLIEGLLQSFPTHEQVALYVVWGKSFEVSPAHSKLDHEVLSDSVPGYVQMTTRAHRFNLTEVLCIPTVAPLVSGPLSSSSNTFCPLEASEAETEGVMYSTSILFVDRVAPPPRGKLCWCLPRLTFSISSPVASSDLP